MPATTAAQARRFQEWTKAQDGGATWLREARRMAAKYYPALVEVADQFTLTEA
jgi:hypothetical protein